MSYTYTTAEASALKSGTSWSIDVTVCNLDADLSLKDFVVIIGGTPISNTLVTKTSPVQLNYSGPDIGTNVLVRVRRRTPKVPRTVAGYRDVISSFNWNKENERVQRILNEWSLFGIDSTGSLSASIQDDPYGISWASDTTSGASRKSLYDKIQTLAPINTPAFTGTPTAPTPSDGSDSTRIATTAHVKSWAKASPTIWTPTVKTPTVTDGGSLAGTFSGSPTFSGNPAFTGNPTTTNSTNANNGRIATAYDVVHTKPLWGVSGATGAWNNINHNTTHGPVLTSLSATGINTTGCSGPYFYLQYTGHYLMYVFGSVNGTSIYNYDMGIGYYNGSTWVWAEGLGWRPVPNTPFVTTKYCGLVYLTKNSHPWTILTIHHDAGSAQATHNASTIRMFLVAGLGYS